MKITIDYGRTGLDIDVPDRNLRAILGLRPSSPLADPEGQVRDRLGRPTGGRPLTELARKASSACILVCDITRPVPNALILHPVLEEIEAAGIPASSIRILIATGLHRASTPAEIVEMLGSDIASRYLVESHDARDSSSHGLAGTTSTGIPAFIDSRYLNADLKITTGLIEPHLMAGFSGGRKVICPGIAGVETIRRFHGVSILQSPLATAGEVAGNPVNALATEVAQLAGCDFIINVALDEQRRVTGVFGGAMIEAWEEGVQHARAMAQAPLAAPVDIVITSAAGYPLDCTFYQAVKGLVGAMPAVRPGGSIIMAARMQEGTGSSEFAGLLKNHSTIEALMESIQAPGFFCIDQWQAQELARACRHAHVTVCSDTMPQQQIARCLVSAARTPEEAIAAAIERHGADASIAVIPRGPYVLPAVG